MASRMQISFSSSQRAQLDTWLACIAIGLGAGLFLEPWLTYPMKWATWCYYLMCAGMLLRKGPKRVHAAFMAAAIAGDLGLVLVLEFQRDAIKTALSFELSALQQAHIGFSTLASLLYVPIAVLGYRQMKGWNSSSTQRKAHRLLGIACFIFRSLGFLCMFSLLEHFKNR